MKKIIKRILYCKSLFVGKGKLEGFIHFSSKIRGYKKIHLKTNSYIGIKVNIFIQNGNLVLGNNSYINNGTNINVVDGDFIIGENSFLNENCNAIILGNIKIGNDVMIAPSCKLISGNHNFADKYKNINSQGFIKKDINIEDNVWIGCGAIILGGITINRGAIIGAGSVVTKDVGENEIWAGNPAKFIKRR